MKSRKNNSLNQKSSLGLKATKILSFIFGLTGMISCIEIDQMNQNISGTKLFIIFALIGFLLAYCSLKLLEKVNIEFYRELNKRSSIIVGGFLGGFILTTPALANYYNRTADNPIYSCDYYTLNEKGINDRKGHSTYFLHFDINGSDEEITTNESVYNYLNKGEKVKLCIAKGRLGFEYIESLIKIEQIQKQ